MDVPEEPEDSTERHYDDTMAAGDHLNDPALVRTLVAEAGAAIRELEPMGAEFVRNDDGGICGRQVKLEVRDHAYNVQTAVSQFSELEPEVLVFVQLLGSPVVSALPPRIPVTRPTPLPPTRTASGRRPGPRRSARSSGCPCSTPGRPSA